MPKTTTIGSYPTFPKPEDVEYYLTISSHGLGDEVVDPYLWSIDEALEDFTSAGIEVPSTGQSRGDLYSIFLDPKVVKGIRWNGAEVFVEDKLSRVASNRLADVLHARSVLPSHYEIKEPITDAYTLARFAKISTGSYRDTRELAKDINRKDRHPGDRGPPEQRRRLLAPAGLPRPGRGVLHARLLPRALRGDSLRGEAAGRPSRVRGRVEDIPGPDEDEGPHDIAGLLSLPAALRRGQPSQLRPADRTRMHGQPEPPRRVRRGDGEDDRVRRARLGEDRIQFVHPHCGQRNLNREVAYGKNVTLTLARDDDILRAPRGGLALAPRVQGLRPARILPGLDTQGEQGDTRRPTTPTSTLPSRALRSRSAERIFQSLNEEADDLGIGRRHLAYLTLELGRAEASLQSGMTNYRQKVIE